MNSYMANPDKVERKWYVVDADGQTLGRLAEKTNRSTHLTLTQVTM